MASQRGAVLAELWPSLQGTTAAFVSCSAGTGLITPGVCCPRQFFCKIKMIHKHEYICNWQVFPLNVVSLQIVVITFIYLLSRGVVIFFSLINSKNILFCKYNHKLNTCYSTFVPGCISVAVFAKIKGIFLILRQSIIAICRCFHWL